MAVRAAVAKSRQAARERAAARAARKAQQEDAARKAKAAEEAERKRLEARVELGRAIKRGDDAGAAEAAALVDIELLATADREGNTPLHGAASRGLTSCCQKILARGDLRPEMLQVCDARGWTPLHCAAASSSGSPELCSMLAENKACSLGAKDLMGRTAVDIAREWGLAEAVTVLMDAAQPELGRSLQSLSIQTPSEAGTNPASRPATASRPTSSAGSPTAGRKSRASAKSTPKSSRKSSPKAKRSIVDKEDKEEVAETEPVESSLELDPLVSPLAEPTVDASAEEKEEELDWSAKAAIEAVNDGQMKKAVEILKRPNWPFVNETDERGRTLLHLGAVKGNVALCLAVLDRDDFEAADKFDNDRATALHLAAANRHQAVCIALVGSGRVFEVNAQDMRDQTPLHLAALRGDEDCYNAILAHEDCNVSVRDYKRRTAPDYAAERGIEAEGQDPLDNPDLELDL